MRPLLSAFRRSLGQIGQDGLFPRFLPQPGRSLTGPQPARYSRQKPGRRSARGKVRGMLEHGQPVTWPHRLRRARIEAERLWAEKAGHPSPPLQGPTVDRMHPDCSHKKTGSSFTGTRPFFMVGMARFERAASASRTLRSSQTEPHPVARGDITPNACRMQAFSQKIFFAQFRPLLLPIELPGIPANVLYISGN